MKTIQPFLHAPNDYVSLHKVLFRHVFPPLSGSAVKILLHIILKTEGWQKEADDISYSQIAAQAGVKSHMTIRRALMELQGYVLVKQGGKKQWQCVPEMPDLIIATANKDERGMDTATTYRLNRYVEIPIHSGSTETVERSTVSVDTIIPKNKVIVEGSSNRYVESITSYESKQLDNKCKNNGFARWAEPDLEAEAAALNELLDRMEFEDESD